MISEEITNDIVFQEKIFISSFQGIYKIIGFPNN